MLAYIARRLLLMIPTLFGIMTINFFIVQAAPGGPVERTIAQIKGTGSDATARITGGTGDSAGGTTGASGLPSSPSEYRGARGLPPELIKEIEKLYGFDKPPLERFIGMMHNYLGFDFGKSFFRDRSVVDLVKDKLPVSISIGLWSTLIIYLISIPLGITKAVRDGSGFDVWSSAVVIVGYAIPGFLFAVLLVVLFAGGSYVNWFPLRGLTSENWSDYSWPLRILDYFWHLVLPITALVIGGFASLTMLTKNSFI
ncbi:MAG: ABC transporter permease subunit, partial [Alphaproteobacteria bacterium]|nr:ABC transporter permease subunit [Alphaproteobacteria bacterium]